jgi:hypothetical protein
MTALRIITAAIAAATLTFGAASASYAGQDFARAQAIGSDVNAGGDEAAITVPDPDQGVVLEEEDIGGDADEDEGGVAELDDEDYEDCDDEDDDDVDDVAELDDEDDEDYEDCDDEDDEEDDLYTL